MEKDDSQSKSDSARKRRLTLPIVAAIFIFGVLLLLVCDWAFAPPEPEFHGRPISEWLGNYHQLKQRDWRETEAAMRAFGTNSIPFILDSFTENDSFWRRWRNQIYFSGPSWLARIVGRSPPRLDTTYAPEIFEAIGPYAIPDLTKALQDRSPTRQMAAARALAYFGVLSTNSLPEIYRCLSNAPPNSKSWTAINSSIAEIESAARRYGNQNATTPSRP